MKTTPPYLPLLQAGDSDRLRAMLNDTRSLRQHFPHYSLRTSMLVWGGPVDAQSGALLRAIVLTLSQSEDPYDPLSYAIQPFDKVTTNPHQRQNFLSALVLDGLSLSGSSDTCGIFAIINALVATNVLAGHAMREHHPAIFHDLYTIIAKALTPAEMCAGFANAIPNRNLTLQHCVVALLAHGPLVLPAIQPIIEQAHRRNLFPAMSPKEYTLLEAWAVGSSHTHLRMLSCLTPDLRKEPPYEAIVHIVDRITASR